MHLNAFRKTNQISLYVFYMQTGIFILSFHNDINTVETGGFNTMY